jgi:predicted nucleic acid-binding protein
LKRLVVVDTSSFVDYLRNGEGSVVPHLAVQNVILLSKIVRIELLKGARKADRKLLLNLLDGLIPLESFPPAALVEEIVLRLHGRGLNLGFADLLILVDAMRSKATILSSDKMMNRAAEILKIGVVT